VNAPLADRIAGCLLGGAVGDALGGVAERGGISLSDDTQLTLATCEAILAAGRVTPEQIAERFRQGFRRTEFTGLGSSTLKALRDLNAGAHWALAGRRGEMAAGNGAAMRVAPLAFALDPADPDDRVTLRDVCRITHHSDEAYIGALVVVLMIRRAVTTPAWEPEPFLFRRVAEDIPDSRVRDRLLEIAELPAGLPLGDLASQFGATGYVVHTVPLAMAAAVRITPESWETVLDEIVRTGGDADTIGSIAGQIAGTRLGLAGIPERLLTEVPGTAGVLAVADEFGLLFG